jgi:hypothetical protein
METNMRRPVIIAALAILAGCAPPPPSDVEVIDQRVSVETALGVGVGLLGAFGEAVQFSEARARMDRLEAALRAIKDEVTSLGAYVDENFENLRELILTLPTNRLKVALERPDDRDGESDVLAHAGAIADERWYHYPPRRQGRPKRYDPRGAAPQLVLQVDGWLKLRDHQGWPADDTRAILADFIRVIDDVATRTRGGVHGCIDTCRQGWFPPVGCQEGPLDSFDPDAPPDCPVAYACRCDTGCRDSLDETNSITRSQWDVVEGETDPMCVSRTSAAMKEDFLRHKYQTQFFEQTLQRWRSR